MRYYKIGYILLFSIFVSCSPTLHTKKKNNESVTGSAFYQKVMQSNWQQRDSIAYQLIENGNIPRFLRKLVPVKISYLDAASKRRYRAKIYVTKDYLSIGTDKDRARVPLTPITAQKIADEFYCFLPTAKIVDDIYNAAKVKLEPVPMYAFRDSSVTMWQHHLIIEGQRSGKKGLIAGIKKDIVIAGKLSSYPKNDRVAIYGWHRMNGKPIQPLYTGHVNWYVDYSHGVRLIYRKIKINGKWMDYQEVLKDSILSQIIDNERFTNYYGYPDAWK